MYIQASMKVIPEIEQKKVPSLSSTSSSLSSDVGTPRDYPSKFITSLKTSSCALYLLVELPPFTGSQKPLGGDVPFSFPLVSPNRNPMYNKELWIGTPLNV